MATSLDFSAVKIKSTSRPHFLYLQAAPTLSGRGSSAKLVTAGLATQSSADSAQAASAAAAITDNNGVALLHTGSGEGSGGALPMEVDDDAMFQKKQPKASKADAAQVRPQPCFPVLLASVLCCRHGCSKEFHTAVPATSPWHQDYLYPAHSQPVIFIDFCAASIHIGHAFGLRPRLMCLSSIAAAVCHPSAVINLSSRHESSEACFLHKVDVCRATTR